MTSRTCSKLDVPRYACLYVHVFGIIIINVDFFLWPFDASTTRSNKQRIPFKKGTTVHDVRLSIHTECL